MPKTRITEKRIRTSKTKAEKTDKALYLWDTELKGLGVYISPKGTVSWLCQRWQGGRGGRGKRIAIGRYPELSLKEARTKAFPILDAAYQGADISQRRVKCDSSDMTLAQAVAQYIEANSVGNRYWKELEARLKCKFIAALGEKTKIRNVTKEHLKPLVNNGPGSRHLFTSLRSFFKWCLMHDLVRTNPLETVPKPKTFKHRDRILSDEEIQVFWTATEQLSSPHREFCQLLLLTGQRRNEVAQAKWDEFQENQWTIPKTRNKSSREHIVHLSTFAREIIDSLGIGRKGPVFCVRGGSSPISGFSKTKDKLDRLMSVSIAVPDWRLHDLRRTAASGLARLGISPHIIEKILNHQSGVNSGLTAIYQRYDHLPDREQAIEAWGDYLRNLVKDHVKPKPFPHRHDFSESEHLTCPNPQSIENQGMP